MKLRIALCTILALMACRTGALAESATTSITLQGTATDVCTWTANGAHGIGTSFTVNNFINTDAVNTSGGINNETIGRVTCNYQAYVGIRTQNGGLIRSGQPVAGFDNKVDYSATLSWASTTAAINTSTATSFTNVVQISAPAATGDAILNVTPIANANPLIAGSYQDILTLQIGASL